MVKFNKPTNLNGTELLAELNAAGINIEEAPFDDATGNLFLNIKSADQDKATPIVAAHNGTTIAPDNSTAKAAAQAKLAALGLTTDDLAALGL